MTDPQVQPKPRSLHALAEELGIAPHELLPFGHDKAKVRIAALERPRPRTAPSRLVLVSAITPTPAGEGKTTTAIGLADALRRRGKRAALALREPSMGPCFGRKGGGTGGGRSQLVPAADINLHFTGDFHAVTTATNLLVALVENHLHFGNELGLDPASIAVRRVLDVGDRTLRSVRTALGGGTAGIERTTGFDITAASEVMAVLCLARDADDLRRRLDRILVGWTRAGEPLFAAALGATGALMAVLRDALHPNLVQTLEGTPAFVHGGPFANIAHGCNSVLATRMALHGADWAVTEAGFGFDLGAEKFFDIKCAGAGLDTAAVVLVASVRALKMHGGIPLSELATADALAVERGCENLVRHVESIRRFGEVPVVALNRFAHDTDQEVEIVRRHVEELRVPFATSTHFLDGGAGALELADVVLAHADRSGSPFHPLYAWSEPIFAKIEKVAEAVYGAAGVELAPEAETDRARMEALGLAGLPVCIAKTQQSLSDDPTLRGRPHGFTLHVRRILPSSGAGFLVVLTGDIVRMPGLPRHPRAEHIDLVEGHITGMT